MTMFKKISLILVLLSSIGFTACLESETKTENKAEDVMENMKDGAEEAGDMVEEGVESVGDSIEDGAEEAGDALEDATE